MPCGKVVEMDIFSLTQSVNPLRWYLYRCKKLRWSTEFAKVSTAKERLAWVYWIVSLHLYHLLRLNSK